MESMVDYFRDCIRKAQEKVGPKVVIKMNAWPKPFFTIHEYEGGSTVAQGNTFEEALGNYECNEVIVETAHY